MFSRSSSSSISLRTYGFEPADCAAPRARSAPFRAFAFVLLAIASTPPAFFSVLGTKAQLIPRKPRSDGGLERLLDPVDVDELEVAPLVLGDLGDVALVAAGQDHSLDPRTLGSERLLLDA